MNKLELKSETLTVLQSSDQNSSTSNYLDIVISPLTLESSDSKSELSEFLFTNPKQDVYYNVDLEEFSVTENNSESIEEYFFESQDSMNLSNNDKNSHPILEILDIVTLEQANELDEQYLNSPESHYELNLKTLSFSGDGTTTLSPLEHYSSLNSLEKETFI